MAADERLLVQLTVRSCCLIDVARELRHHRRSWIGVALAGIALGGCGVAGPEPRTFVGPVTVVDSTGVCIGGPEATGECLVKDRLTRDLHVSDCVRVTYVVREVPGPSTATKVDRLDAAENSKACPRQ